MLHAVGLKMTIAGTGCRLTLTVVRYEFPEERSGGDANWLDGSAELMAGRSGRFSAAHELWLRTEELRAFREELRGALDSGSGEAALEHLEEQFGCTIRLTNGRGDLEAYLCEHVGARLTVTQAEVDRAMLTEALRELDAIVEAFPVRGDPDEERA